MTPAALAKAAELVKRFEGCRLEAYRCPSGHWTIGWGHTRDVREGQRISQHEADIILESDLGLYAEGVEALCGNVGLTDGQLGALTSFAYNVGLPEFAGSTLLRKLRRGDYMGAVGEFAEWVWGDDPKRKGQKWKPPGLKTRRMAEYEVFINGG